MTDYYLKDNITGNECKLPKLALRSIPTLTLVIYGVAIVLLLKLFGLSDILTIAGLVILFSIELAIWLTKYNWSITLTMSALLLLIPAFYVLRHKNNHTLKFQKNIKQKKIKSTRNQEQIEVHEVKKLIYRESRLSSYRFPVAMAV